MKDRFGKVSLAAVLAMSALAASGCCHSHHHHDEQGMKEDEDEHEEKIDVSKVPDNVKAVVAQAMPDSTITEAEKETYDGKPVYELDVKTAAGRPFEVK